MSEMLKKFTKASAAILRKIISPFPGSDDIADSIGYIENAGTPVSVLTPDFIGQWCFDTTNGVYYRATGAANTAWARHGADANGNLRVTRVLQSQGAATSDATVGPRTFTAAEILGGTIVRDPNGASRSDVLPTAALLVAALPNAAVGDIIECEIVNGADAAEVITIGAGVGGGFDTNQTASARVIPQNASKSLRIRLTNVTAASEAYVAYL